LPRGGTITLSAARTVVEDGGRPGLDAGDYVMLVVRDNGLGMDEETLSRAFEPFFTTKPYGMGSGLGLATVYGIVRQSGAHVWIESEVGIGTTVTICFATEHAPKAVA
jgi:signal transduction histidine kinase